MVNHVAGHRNRPDHRHQGQGLQHHLVHEQCLSNVLRLEIYIQDAEREGDSELADFFRRAQSESRKGAEKGKQLLATRITA